MTLANAAAKLAPAPGGPPDIAGSAGYDVASADWPNASSIQMVAMRRAGFMVATSWSTLYPGRFQVSRTQRESVVEPARTGIGGGWAHRSFMLSGHATHVCTSIARLLVDHLRHRLCGSSRVRDRAAAVAVLRAPVSCLGVRRRRPDRGVFGDAVRLRTAVGSMVGPSWAPAGHAHQSDGINALLCA